MFLAQEKFADSKMHHDGVGGFEWWTALERGPRIRLYQQFGDRLERIADRQRVNEENLIAERIQAYANQLPEMVFIE